MRIPLLTALLTLCAPAAAQAPGGAEAGQTPPQDQRIQRALADLAQARTHLDAPHAFRGAMTFRSYNEQNQLLPLDRTFVGASAAGDRWFTMGTWRVLQRDGRTVVQRSPDAGWSAPLGDTPDVPLTPSILLPHFSTAQLTPPQPDVVSDRPVMRVHARWTGKAAKAVLFAATAPSTQHEQLLEGLAGAARRGSDKVQVRATVLYDPATRRFLQAALRLAYLDGRPFADGAAPPRAPHGLPPLPGRCALEAVWFVEACALEQAPAPALDDEARRLLAKPRRR